MGARAAVVLVALACGLGALALWLQGRDLRTPSGRPAPFPPTAGWSADDERGVNRLALRRGEGDLEFAKDAAGYWMLTRPGTCLAEQGLVLSLLAGLLHPETGRVLDLAGAYAERAAAKEAVRVELASAGGRGLSAAVFDMPGQPGQAYIAYGHQPGKVHKVPLDTPLPLRLPADDFRSRRIFPFPLDAVERMTYSRGGRTLTLEGDGRGGWRSSAPLQPAAAELLRAWESAGCAGRLPGGRPAGAPLASWSFDFPGGRTARCDLYEDGDGAGRRFLLYYQGREEGQVLDERTAAAFFPEPSFLVREP